MQRSLIEKNKKKVCPNCTFDENLEKSTQCPICYHTLVYKSQLKEKSKSETKLFETSKSAKRPADKTSSSKKKGSRSSSKKAGQTELVLKNKTEHWLNFVRKNKLFSSSLSKQANLKEVQKPLNLLGLFVIGMGMVFLFNAFYLRNKVEAPPPNQNSEVVTTKKAPQGVFNYGGESSVFAPLAAAGINSAMEMANPNFELRYTKPINDDYSSSNGINMLLDGELSFAYNARPLSNQEFKQANLQSMKLNSVPIALDGVVMYSNIEVPKSKLNRDQIKKIYRGELTNWNQVDKNIGDLPIEPVIVKDQNLQFLGLSGRGELSRRVKTMENHTLAFRKVIRTPGAISFGSFSLVEEQMLVKKFDLAEGSSSNYIKPTIDNFKNTTYPLTRRVYLVSRKDGTIDEQAAKAQYEFFVSPEGQEIVEKARLVPIF